MELMKMLREDHLYFGKYYIRALSILWWIVRLGQFGLLASSIYIAYIGCWLLLG